MADWILKSNLASIMKELDNIISQGLDEAGAMIAGQAQENAPVDTGRLRGSITWRTAKKYVSVGSRLTYAPYQEYGTSRNKAQPFLTPAFEGNKDKIKEIFERLLGGL